MTRKLSIGFLLFLLFHFSFSQEDSTSYDKNTYKHFIAPATLIGLGLYSRYDVPFGKQDVRSFRNEHFSTFHNNLDDYLQFAPIGFAYGLGVFPNMKSKSDFVNKSVLLVKSELMMAAIVYPLKYLVADKRPNSDSRNAWPSGHTTQAFVAAAFLDHEYRHKSIWISVASYSCAATVGIMRILNGHHWSADVLAGAGIGILVVNLAYWTHQYKWNNFKFLENKEVGLIPVFDGNHKGLALAISL